MDDNHKIGGHKRAAAGEPTTQEVAEAIETLRNLLFRAYGLDYSFHIAGKGATLAAATLYHGVVEAVTRSPGSEK